MRMFYLRAAPRSLTPEIRKYSSLYIFRHKPEADRRSSVVIIPAFYPKFPSSKFYQETSCSDWCLSSFNSVSPGKFRDSTSN